MPRVPATRATIPDAEDVERTIPPPEAGGEVDSGRAAPASGYRPGRLLGQGGEGEVHEAVQLAFLRPVAIKTLRAADPSPRRLRRFRAEAAVTALLEHPNIVPVHDLCNGPDGRPQLVMKKVGGRTWRALIDGQPPAEGRPPLRGDEHIDILLKVCDAIAFAHSRGILHRDLKPENVMVGDHGEVLVMDWGCAAHVGPRPPHPDIPVLAGLSGVSGTPAYLPPEMARGDHAACGPWSDVYLLGGTLYRLLTGTPPWRDDGAAATIRLAARGEPPEDLARRAGRKVSGELARICLQAMHPEPASRMRSVDELANALRRHLEHREVHRLVAEARRQHEQARAGGPTADDAYRRALSATEQALQLWPEQPAARRLFIEIGLDSSRHALAAGAFRLAKRQAQAARSEADRLGEARLEDSASRLAVQAENREKAQHQREAKLLTMRRLAVAGGVIAGLAMIAGLLAAWHESSRTARALDEAKANLARFESERTARVEGERLAAPALLAQARDLALDRRFEDALRLARTAIGFAPDDPAPLVAAAQLSIALGRRPEAVELLGRAEALRHDPDAAELRRLCGEPPADAESRIAAVLVRMGAAGAAGALNVAADQRAALARTQLAKAWPRLPATAVTALPDGTLAVSIKPAAFELESLEPLRGLPVSIIDIGGQRKVRDIEPLRGLPLQEIYMWSTQPQDFSPLKDLRLRRLSIAGTGFADLDLLADMPLEYYDGVGTGLTSLNAFTRFRLRELRLYGCDQMADISAAANMPIEALLLDGPRRGATRLTSLVALRGRPLRDLSLCYQRGVADLTPLRGAPLTRLVLTGTAVADLAPVVNPALRTLAIDLTPVADLAPLLRAPLESIDLSPQGIRSGLDELARMPSLRTINGMPRADFPRWAALQRTIAAANPAYQWNARPLYADGKPVELRFEPGLRSLDFAKGLPLRVLRVERGTFTEIPVCAGMPLVELELPGCAVANLAPLAGLKTLRSVDISGCPVADLGPIAALPLETLVFNPSMQQNGLAAVRASRTIKRLGQTATQLMAPAEFWKAFDRGQMK